MPEPNKQDKIPFEEHPLYDLYKAGHQQWNHFMASYISRGYKEQIIKNNPDINLGFKSIRLLLDEREKFKEYMSRKLEEGNNFTLDFTNYVFDKKVNFDKYFFPVPISFSGSIFCSEVNFNNVVFCKKSNFNKTIFHKRINFKGLDNFS